MVHAKRPTRYWGKRAKKSDSQNEDSTTTRYNTHTHTQKRAYSHTIHTYKIRISLYANFSGGDDMRHWSNGAYGRRNLKQRYFARWGGVSTRSEKFLRGGKICGGEKNSVVTRPVITQAARQFCRFISISVAERHDG